MAPSWSQRRRLSQFSWYKNSGRSIRRTYWLQSRRTGRPQAMVFRPLAIILEVEGPRRGALGLPY